MNPGRRFALSGLAVLAMLACGTPGAARAGSIDYEKAVDFRTVRTFSIRDGRIDSRKPEVDNRLFRQRMNDTIRAVLAKKGLREVASGPDVFVTFHFADGDYSEVERMPPTRVPDMPGMRGFVVPGSGPRPVLYTEGTLIIDMFDASSVLVWRGTWRERERNGPKLSKKLSGDVRKLLSGFPPRTK